MRKFYRWARGSAMDRFLKKFAEFVAEESERMGAKNK